MIEFPEILEDLISQHTGEESEYIKEIWKDFWICNISREASLIARKEVLTGKAKFGIVGDGKELPQVALARACLLYTSPSPRDRTRYRMPSSA